MGMAEPLALVALLAAAAPLLLHLRLRRAGRIVRFPNIELVRSAGRETGRERIVADAWLLAARAAVVALAGAAVARPYLGERRPSSDALSGRDVVVALDRSGTWPSRQAFDEARAAAGEALDVASRTGRAVLLPFDDLPGPVVDSAEARRALRGLRPTGRAAPPEAMLASAIDAAARVRLPGGPPASAQPRTVLLLTTLEGAEAAIASGPRPGVKLVAFVPPACAPPRPDVGAVRIDEALLVPPSPGAPDEVRVEVALSRRGGGAATEACRLRLYLEGPRGAPAPPAEATVEAAEFDSSGICVVSIGAKRRGPGADLARVEVVTSDARAASRFVLVPPSERLSVLCLGGRDGGPRNDAAPKDGELMWRALRALAAASGSSAAVGPVEAVSGELRDVNAKRLGAFDAVAVGDVGVVDARAWGELERFVRSGGAVVAASPGGLDEGGARLFGVASAAERVSAPEGFRVARPAPAIEGSAGGMTAGFACLKGVRFPSRLVLDASRGGEVALAFDDGAPALVVRRLGRGRAGLFAAGLGHLAGRPSVLVPLVDALLKGVARRPAAPLVMSPADTPVVVELDAGSTPSGLELIAPDGARSDVALVREPGAGGRAFAQLACEGPGLWRLVVRGRRAVEVRTLRLIGVNAGRAAGGEGSAGGGSAAAARILRSRAELLAEVRDGPVELGAVFAFLALAALAAELALLEGRAQERSRASSSGRPSKGGGG